MQYILTQEEYDALKKERKHEIELSVSKLQKLCTKISDEMPIKRGWAKDEEPKPWGCVITQEKDGDEWYCDSCPVQDICPKQYKPYSK